MSLDCNSYSSFKRTNNNQVFQENGELKDDGLNKAVARAKIHKRRLSDDQDGSAKKTKAVVNTGQNNNPNPVISQAKPVNLKRHPAEDPDSGNKKNKAYGEINAANLAMPGEKRNLNEDRDSGIKKAREFGEMNAANLAMPGQKRNLNEDRDSGIKKAREFGEMNAANLAQPGDKRNMVEDHNPRVKKPKDSVEELAELFDSGIRINDDHIQSVSKNIKALACFIKVTNQGVEKIYEEVVFRGGRDSIICGDRLLASCKTADAEQTTLLLSNAKDFNSLTRKDDSGQNAYSYAKQNGMEDIVNSIQKNFVSIFYEASIKNDQELASDLWKQFAAFDIEEDRLFDLFDPGEQYGVLADMRIRRVLDLIKDDANNA